MKCSFVCLLLFFLGISNSFCQRLEIDSSKNGKFSLTEKNGLKVSGMYKNSKRCKIWTWHYPDGTLYKQIKYKKSKLIWILYFENNKAWLKINRFGKRKVIRQCNCREPEY
ncbi:MAG: hypothetical protein HUU47_10930 [Bacteroidetes bacterium]|nr:hypothetical protein [Bacteroidota bacterium]